MSHNLIYREPILSISEAAEYVGVFVLTLRLWEKKGFIKSFRTPGGHRRYKKCDLDKIIGNQTKSGQLHDAIQALENIQTGKLDPEIVSKIISDLKSLTESL